MTFRPKESGTVTPLVPVFHGADVSDTASPQVQLFTGTVNQVRFGTSRCVSHARSAPSGAARADRVSPQVRNTTQSEAPVKIRHSR